MALKLDNALLDELGLGALPEHEKQQLLRQIYEKLEMNVGMRLADQMTNEQLDAFEKFVEANDDKGAFQWLETNFPNYKDVVNDEFEKLKLEIKQYAPQMLAVASQNAVQPQQPVPPQPMQPVADQPGMQNPQSGYPSVGQYQQPIAPSSAPYSQSQYPQAQQPMPSQQYGQPGAPYTQPAYPGQAAPYPEGHSATPPPPAGASSPYPQNSPQQPPVVPGQ